MRELTNHRLSSEAPSLNEDLQIIVVDAPGPGGACHHYQILDVSKENTVPAGDATRTLCDIEFQHGPIKEHGVNGISNEALLAVLIDRLRGFQAGEFACGENGLALAAARDALRWLHARTRDRIERGVEGTAVK